MGERIANFYETVERHLRQAKSLLLDHYAILLGNLVANANKSEHERTTVRSIVEKIEKAERGLSRWLQYVGYKRNTTDFQYEPGTASPNAIEKARSQVARAIAIGGAFLDEPSTTEKEAKGLFQIIDAMEDVLELLK